MSRQAMRCAPCWIVFAGSLYTHTYTHIFTVHGATNKQDGCCLQYQYVTDSAAVRMADAATVPMTVAANACVLDAFSAHDSLSYNLFRGCLPIISPDAACRNMHKSR